MNHQKIIHNLNGDKQSHNVRGSKNIISTFANKRSKDVTSNNNYNTKTKPKKLYLSKIT